MSQPCPRYVRLKRADAEPSRKPEMDSAETQDNYAVNPQTKNPNPKENLGRPEQNNDEFYPLSGKPFFSVIIGKTNVKPNYQLFLPVNIHSRLPFARVPAVLKYYGKCWDLEYIGNDTRRRFQGGLWKAFVIDNGLKIGDACVFELSECSDYNLEFKVQILRGDFPAELLNKATGVASNAPIVID